MQVARRVGVEPAPVALDRLAHRPRMGGEHERDSTPPARIRFLVHL
jgi:hypothetical protein